MLNSSQIGEFKENLDARFLNLREEIRQELLNSDEQHFIDLAGQVHDLEEESVANLLVDIDLAIIDLHLDEIKDIDAALLRIEHGNYGICTDCNDDIKLLRLQAYVTAKRCQPCQVRYEHDHAGYKKASL